MKEEYMQQTDPDEVSQTVESNVNDFSEFSNDDLPETSTGDNSLDQSRTDEVYTLPQECVRHFVLKEVQLKLMHGHSISTAEGHLTNISQLLGGQQVPTKWAEVLQLLRSLGYRNPTHYKDCVEKDHSTLLTSNDPSSPKCQRPRNSCIDYYVLGLNFQDWFLTKEQCDSSLVS